MALWMGIVVAWFGLALVAGLLLGPILHGLDRPVRTRSASAGHDGSRAAGSGRRRRPTHAA
jgi:hypothetical protein